jgi:uncharacterized membrane protein
VLTARRLAAAFVLYGLLATGFLAFNTPPFQVVDEGMHLMRAAMLADGRLFGTRYTQTDADGSQHRIGGGPVDPRLLEAWGPFLSGLRLNPDARVTQAMLAPNTHWSDIRIMLPMPTTAMYPPFFYAPATIAVLVGRVSRMTVVQTLITSRLLTAAAAVAIGAVAIAWSGSAAIWLFAILTLPKSLTMIASSSQDALMLACSALAGALSARPLREGGEITGRRFAGIAALLSLVAMARPPYAALALLPIGMTAARLRWRIAAATAVAACGIGWAAIASTLVLTNLGAPVGADPAAQMLHLRSHPLAVIAASVNALAQSWPVYFRGFIGPAATDPFELPAPYFTAAGAMLVVAGVAATLASSGGRAYARGDLVIAAGLLLSVAGVFGAEYILWTPPGSPVVAGVQGRYFLPLAVIGAALLPSFGTARWLPLRNCLVLAVLAFPIVSLGVLMRAVVLRFYLQ